eukprot:scaffold34408_cov14-Tisochrysis_lutea.AAC.1
MDGWTSKGATPLCRAAEWPMWAKGLTKQAQEENLAFEDSSHSPKRPIQHLLGCNIIGAATSQDRLTVPSA